MAEIEVKDIDQKEVWESFIETRPEANFLHSWYWGEFHENIGHKVVRRGYYDGGKLVGVLLGIVEPARRGRHLIVPGGPIIDWGNKSLAKTWVSDAKKIALENKCVFVRARPQLDLNENSIKIFRGLGFKKAPMHLHAELTSQLDLRKSDEEIKKGMRKGAKYELNKAIKLNIKVTSTTGPELLDKFYDLQIATAERQHFVPFTKNFLSKQFEVFAAADKVKMYSATYEGKLLAMAFIIFYGKEAAYHYGASTELARKFPGAYIIQWEAIQEARRRGCLRYNFWGVTEHGLTKHRFYGVSVFKRGFGGEDVAYLPAQDFVVNRKLYYATYLFETARRKIRHL